ncbi:MAG: metal-dependent hydrolase [Pseudonocardia sp.]|uniref:metal-dependent hydrolase n=1 Tax=Pseudonocardia sp. TaxID=60912 RepID=UPI001AD3DFF5|nr:metal-dependent hydrolase [Pseudonocardia sp.]MBN9100669.1 metal-dependent hydrolase [Pseudonocardia sp.]
MLTTGQYATMRGITVGEQKKTLRGADVGIPPRQLDFRLNEEMPRWLYAGNATATLFLVVLSGAFPPGEDFFVQSVNRFKHRVTDPTLRAQVAGFTGQEVIHSREHDRLNDVFRSRDIDVDVPEKAIALALRLLDLLPARQRLACTAQMEHLTALLAEELLSHEDFRTRIHDDLTELWLWHALEELEHKSVSYEVYETVGNSRRERVLAEVLVDATIIPAALVSWIWLVLAEGVWRRPRDIRDGVRMLFGPGGFVGRIIPRVGVFRKPDFHPDRHDTTALEAEWRERLFGPDGTLRDQLRRRA